MSERPCGHPLADPLADAELGCSRYRCKRNVVACVVYVGREDGEKPCWTISPTCRKHLKLLEQTARRARHSDYPGVFRHHPRMAKILEWIHSDQRCDVDCVSVTTHAN